MGYYTNYHLEVRNIKANEFDLLCKIFEGTEVLNDILMGWAFDNQLDLPEYNPDGEVALFYPARGGQCTWYEHDQDMPKIAKLFPNATFCLEGHGDDDDDTWRKYFHGDEYECCWSEVVFKEPSVVKWD